MAEAIIRKHALANAVKYNGKANPKSIIGKIIAEKPEVKKDMRSTMEKINSIVEDVNRITLEEQKEELENNHPEMLEKKEKPKKDLKDLPNANERPVVMRFEPSPSGPMHIGHAYPAALNCEYAKRYNGKMILRISDTNPDNIDPDSYDLLKEDGDWLFGEYDFYIQSDRLENYYRYAEKLMKEGKAYICTCDPEKFRELKKNKTACPCRQLNEKEQMERWEKMGSSYKQGEAVMRFKTDIAHKNPAMRDFPIMRINDSPHPRTGNKYRVWPLMTYSVAVDDMEMEVSHTLRGKDHMDNAKKQAMIHNALGYKTPDAISVGRINFTGFPVSCSKARELIDQGKYTGWDDIRLPFLRALRKRGFLARSIIDFAKEMGVTQTDKSVAIDEYFKTIESLNRSYLDKEAKRFFFIREPKEITIEGAPDQELNLKLHPDDKEGKRPFSTDQKFYIEAEDYENLKENEVIRLMNCLNFTREGDKLKFHSTEHEKFSGNTIIHWLPKDNAEKATLVTTEGEKEGLAEKNISQLKRGEIVQFERVGFCRFDGKFYYAHK
ncbi:MAG: glutamate--tRNA ligase [Nanobdellota archaeon]